MKLPQQMAIARIVIGAAALLAPSKTSRLMGFPGAQDNPTARLMGRLFAVRDIALGALVLGLREDDPAAARFVYKLNAAVDAGDAASMAAAIIGRQGIDRAALSSAAIAAPAAVAWTQLAKATT